ncbi:MAG TPA: FTR1 family protein [Burkholderiales bacterium]|nr:FTR1 family protein [Burkholderiales bacterium]
MTDMLVITLREGIESFLIVAIAAAYLRKTGREALLPAVWSGTAVALAISVVVGGWLLDVAPLPVYEGVLAAVAAVLVISMAIYMNSAGKRMGAEIGARIDAAALKPGAGAWLGVFLFVVLMVSREGVETAFMTIAIARNEDSGGLVAGALIGVALAATVAWAWLRWGRRVNLTLFFQATAIFLVLFSLQLLLYAFHEFTEAQALPLDNTYWHMATEEWAEGRYARIYSALMVLLPLAWAAYATLRKRMS